MNIVTKRKIQRYTLYAVMLLLASIFQNTLHIFPEILSVRPVLLISVSVCIAMFEGEAIGALAGFLAGAVWDTVTVAADGYNAFYLMTACAVCGMVLRVFMRNNLITFFMMNSLVTSIYFIFYVLFFISARGVAHGGIMLLRYYLPMAVYSILLTPIWYYIIKAVNRRFSSDYVNV